jgi:hypothetical protein
MPLPASLTAAAIRRYAALFFFFFFFFFFSSDAAMPPRAMQRHGFRAALRMPMPCHALCQSADAVIERVTFLFSTPPALLAMPFAVFAYAVAIFAIH